MLESCLIFVKMTCEYIILQATQTWCITTRGFFCCMRPTNLVSISGFCANHCDPVLSEDSLDTIEVFFFYVVLFHQLGSSRDMV